MLERWTASITGLWTSPTVRIAALTLYYLAVLWSLIVLYGRGDFSTPSFVYQEF